MALVHHQVRVDPHNRHHDQQLVILTDVGVRHLSSQNGLVVPSARHTVAGFRSCGCRLMMPPVTGRPCLIQLLSFLCSLWFEGLKDYLWPSGLGRL